MRRALLLLSLIAAHAISAGSALEAANDPRALQLVYEPWIKICFSHSDCLVAAGARGACDPSGGGLSVGVLNEKNGNLFAIIGTKHPLEAAISVQIDQDAPISTSHPECFGFGCGGKLEIDSRFVERLKRSQTITIEAVDKDNNKLSLSLSLADFAKAYDGPPIGPPKVQEFTHTSDEMKAMMKRAEEEKKLRECKE
jgi:invasion protein IalB